MTTACCYIRAGLSCIGEVHKLLDLKCLCCLLHYLRAAWANIGAASDMNHAEPLSSARFAADIKLPQQSLHVLTSTALHPYKVSRMAVVVVSKLEVLLVPHLVHREVELLEAWATRACSKDLYLLAQDGCDGAGMKLRVCGAELQGQQQEALVAAKSTTLTLIANGVKRQVHNIIQWVTMVAAALHIELQQSMR